MLRTYLILILSVFALFNADAQRTQLDGDFHFGLEDSISVSLPFDFNKLSEPLVAVQLDITWDKVDSIYYKNCMMGQAFLDAGSLMTPMRIQVW